jgi:dTMP kinase
VRGRWIALEGGEGTGKSTQAARLAARLGALATREPGATALGARLRAVLLDADPALMDGRAEALLMAADRAQHVAEVVEPALRAGRDVVSDRSAWSSLAYQGGGRALGLDDLWRLNDWATDRLWPEVVVLLEVPPGVAAARIGAPRDRLEAAGATFHERVAQTFDALAARHGWSRVDGEGSVDDVAERVWRAVGERVGHDRGR